MRTIFFSTLFILIYTGCKTGNKYPDLSTDYLQPVLSEIRKIDSGAKVLQFVPADEKFEFVNDVIKSRFFEVGSIDIKGDPVEVTQREYNQQLDSSFTKYILYDKQIIEKQLKDLKDDEVYQVRYNKNLIDQVSRVRRNENDTGKIRFQYNDDGRLIKKKLYSASGVMYLWYELKYTANGNPDYAYTLVESKGDGFDKFEFNNKERQYILSRFDKHKKLLWLNYRELDSNGTIQYEERYEKKNGDTIFRKDEYMYNGNDEITSLRVQWPLTKRESLYDFAYSERDEAGNWILQLTFENNNFFLTTTRTIKYRRKR